MVFGSYATMFFILLSVILITCPRINSIAGNFTLKVVDQSGYGDYRRIQDAIDSVSSGNTENVLILVRQGVYREKVIVPSDKPSIILSGIKAEKTVISWNDHGNIFSSPTMSVLASDFICRYLTIQVFNYLDLERRFIRASSRILLVFMCMKFYFNFVFLPFELLMDGWMDPVDVEHFWSW